MKQLKFVSVSLGILVWVPPENFSQQQDLTAHSLLGGISSRRRGELSRERH